jgi:hypothetical protein
MKSSLASLALSASTIAALPAWRSQQALILTSEILMSFLALFLISNGIDQMRALALFCGIYLVSGLLVRLQREVRPGVRLMPMILAVGGAAATVTTAAGVAPALSISLAALCIFTLKDLSTTSAVGDIHAAATRVGLPPISLVSTGMLLGALLMIVLLSGAGHVLEHAPWGWLAFLLIVNACILASLMRGIIRIKTPAARILIPGHVRAICALSVLYNATYFVGRRFVLPLAVAQMAQDLGLGEQAYASLGMVLSLLVLLGLATRSMSGRKTDPHQMMYAGFFSGLLLWIALSLLVLFTPGITGVIAALACLFLIEITTKIWSLGFIDVLRLASRDASPASLSEVELAYFGYFMEMKNYGAAIGFAIALMALVAGFPALIPTATLGLFGGVMIWLRSRKARLIPA